MRTNDTLAGAILITIALAMIALTINFPLMPGQKYGPALFPRLLGAGMIMCGMLLILRGRRNARPALALASWAADPWRRVSFALMLALPLAAIFAWTPIGFVPTTLVSLLLLLLWFRTRPATALLAALVATALLQIFFGKLMRVPLPLGWLLELPPHWLKYLT